MMQRHLKDIKAKIEQKNIHNMKLPFEGPFKNKYAGRSPERILCLYSVRLVIFFPCFCFCIARICVRAMGKVLIWYNNLYHES